MIFAGGFSSYGAGCIYSTYVVVFSSSCPLKTFGPACVPACYSGILQYLCGSDQLQLPTQNLWSCVPVCYSGIFEQCGSCTKIFSIGVY